MKQFPKVNTPLHWLNTAATGYDFGVALGQQGRESVHAGLLTTPLWQQIIADKHAAKVALLAKNTQQQFPEIFAELQGLADGLALPFEQVFAWNCRGDLLTHTADGCTTVQIPGDKIIIAHNEDGLPVFDGKCFIVERTGEGGFSSFAYPGSIPGHTFGMTNSGLVMATNNLRLSGFDAKIPRMVLARELLNCNSVDQARTHLSNNNTSGGFHFSLAQMGDPRLISLEFGAGHTIDKEITVPSLHANHALMNNDAYQSQIITQSSQDRQQRGTELVEAGQHQPLDILRDKSADGLPIWRREADDPDDENTIASAVFEISANKINSSTLTFSSITICSDSRGFTKMGLFT